MSALKFSSSKYLSKYIYVIIIYQRCLAPENHVVLYTPIVLVCLANVADVAPITLIVTVIRNVVHFIRNVYATKNAVPCTPFATAIEPNVVHFFRNAAAAENAASNTLSVPAICILNTAYPNVVLFTHTAAVHWNVITGGTAIAINVAVGDIILTYLFLVTPLIFFPSFFQELAVAAAAIFFAFRKLRGKKGDSELLFNYKIIYKKFKKSLPLLKISVFQQRVWNLKWKKLGNIRNYGMLQRIEKITHIFL